MTSYKAYYEILNSRNNSYEEHHMYLGAHSHSDAETRVRNLVKSLYHYEPHIIAIYTTEEEQEARDLEFHLERARTRKPITCRT